MPMPIRILHILLSPGIGGMESRVARLAAGLDRERFRVEVLTFRPAQGAVLALPPGTPHHAFPIAPGFKPLRLLALAAFIRRGRYDVVHTHNWGSMLYGVAAARLAGCRLVLHGEHGLNRSDLAGIPPKRLWAQRLLARLAHRIVAVNAPIAAFAQQNWRLPAARIATIPNGVDLQRFGPRRRPEPEAWRLGMVGRLDAVKDIGCALRAVARLRDEGKAEGLRLILVGDGPLGASLEAEARELGIAGQVEFAGPRPDVENAYAGFDAYLNASVYEGMSNTLLEAMASGLPLIVSRVPGNAAWIREGENALFFAAGDAAGLAERIGTMRNDPQEAEGMGRRNRLRAEREFDNRGFIGAYTGLYRELLGLQA